MSARMDRLEFYRETVEIADVDQDSVYIGVVPGDWRWTLVAAENGKKLAWSEGYRRRIDAVRNAARVLGVDDHYIESAVRFAAREGGDAFTDDRFGTVLVVVVKP